MKYRDRQNRNIRLGYYHYGSRRSNKSITTSRIVQPVVHRVCKFSLPKGTTFSRNNITDRSLFRPYKNKPCPKGCSRLRLLKPSRGFLNATSTCRLH